MKRVLYFWEVQSYIGMVQDLSIGYGLQKELTDEQ
jgi:hypothetical protein